MLRCGICSRSILIYVVGVSSLSGRRATVAPLSWKERSRRQLLENWEGLGKLKQKLEPPPAFRSAYVSAFPVRVR
jgi:hypothetical protein